jgi:hypothetical protein
MKRKLVCSAIFFLILCFATTGVYAYTSSSAISYAKKYALSPNTASFPKYDSDCANFASQCLNAGGINMTTNWHCKKTIFTISNYFWDETKAWTRASNLKSWLIDCGYATLSQKYSRQAGFAYPPEYSSKLATGKLVFYDFTGNNSIDHVSILTSVTGSGASLQSNICQHTTNRKDVVWHLGPYMSDDEIDKCVYYVFYVS